MLPVVLPVVLWHWHRHRHRLLPLLLLLLLLLLLHHRSWGEAGTVG
jgi:hypothetical protein